MRRLSGIWRATALLSLLALLVPGSGPALAQTDPAQRIILERINQLRDAGELTIRDEWVAGRNAVIQLYESRNYNRAWTDAATIEQLHRAVQGMWLDGLDPADYHLETLLQLAREIEAGADPEALADFDILATDALARVIYHCLFGKVDPESLDPHWNLTLQLEGIQPGTYIQEILDSGELYDHVESEKPDTPFYTGMKAALAEYREIQAAGGWPAYPDGPDLEVGTSDPRVPILRQQLTVTGDHDGPPSASTVYDEELEDAVQLFQLRHELPQTGLVGSMTRAALSVPVEERIDQIRVNLERGRWVLHDLADKFLVVNIAAFKVYLVENGRVTWTGRAQVGRTYRKTPVFKSEIRYMDVNPTWTVPRTILERDILPRVKQDPGYLESRGLKVLDRNGDEVDPATVDWSRYSTAAEFPYLLRQGPGPRNALGRIKFMFPNKYSVYLHDTPSRQLFERTQRAFSSGCVRVERPFELAELLMNNPEQWSRQRFLEIRDSGETTSVFLTQRMPVLLLYWTAEAGLDDYVHFRPNIYERDGPVLERLNGEFQIRSLPPVVPPSQ